MADISKIKVPSGTEYDIKDNNAVTNITRNGTTFTATKRDGTTFTFTQQDNNTWTALKGATASAAGTAGYAPAPPSDGYNTKYLRADGTWVVPPNTNTDTHYTANLITGASATATANAAATNGNVYLNLYENGSVRNAHNIKGTGATTVTTDANGVVTINSTNSTYTAASAAPANVATAAVTGNSANYARQDHVHAISVATGDSNGQVKIAGTNISVKGLGSNAYTSTTFAPLNSPGLTGTPTAPTAADGTNNNQIATTQFVMNAFKANDAMIFKGTLGTGGTITALPDTHYQGWTYRVITAGTYAGKACEIGDMIICVTDGTAANNDHWTVVQSNIDGAVTGPTSATDARVAVFNGTSGKVIKDSGYTIASSVPSGAKFTDTTYTFTDNNPTLAWGTKSKVATVGGTEIHVTMPANPNTDTKVTQTNGTWNYEGRVLLSWNGNDTTETNVAAKSTNFRANPSTGKFRATYYNVADHVDMQYNTTTQALDFIFS